MRKAKNLTNLSHAYKIRIMKSVGFYFSKIYHFNVKSDIFFSDITL